MTEVLLDVRDLRASFQTEGGIVQAVDGVSFRLERGQNMGLVGESGCGKSSLIKALTKVFPKNFQIDNGEIHFRGRDLVPLSYEEMRPIRWKEVAIVPQSAMNALDPAYTVGWQIEEAILEHESISRSAAKVRVAELFELVGIDPARANGYPHHFSGGMKQRANIAMALALNPPLLIADEPTTALDVIVQDQIFQKLLSIQKDRNASMLLVTHDISLVAENCDVMAVMYSGRFMEYAPVRKVFSEPMHPYTLALKNAFPDINRSRSEPLISIPKSPPVLIDFPDMCRFSSRCPFRTEICMSQAPLMQEHAPGHFVACHHLDRVDEFRDLSKRVETWDAIATRAD